LLPDLVIAFTCTPVDRPIVASKPVGDELEFGDRILAELRLAAGADVADTCWPSTFSWNSRASPPFRSAAGICAAVPGCARLRTAARGLAARAPSSCGR
jgi:hypothetical protein